MPKKLEELKLSLRKWSGRGIFAILDQGLISGSNFLIAILLARWLAPQQYGSYALAFEIFLFLAALYGSLILEPMSVFGPSVYSGNLTSYLGGLLRIHCVLSLLMMAALFATAAALHAVRPTSLLPDALVGIGAATPCLLLFWLARRGFYIVFLPQKAVLGACIYSALLLTGLALLYKFRSPSPFSAFLLLAAGAIATGPLLLRWFKAGLVETTPGFPLMDIVRRHWTYGRWAVANSVVIWCSLAIYYPLLGSFFTLAEAGKFKALMNLASPIGQAFVAVSLLSLPVASRAHHQDGNIADRIVWRLTLLYVGGSCLYWAVLLLLRGPIVHHLYGGRYMQVINLLPWVALGSILRISGTAQTLVLKAMHSPAKAFLAYSTPCVVSIALGVPCTHRFGLRGALFAWVLSSAAALIGAVLVVRRESKRQKFSEEVPTGALTMQEEVPLTTRG
ncbi:MAG: polysaccharide biosynthesis C-terminal domain-containing protein [Terriglobia bacterium]